MTYLSRDAESTWQEFLDLVRESIHKGIPKDEIVNRMVAGVPTQAQAEIRPALESVWHHMAQELG